MAESLSRSQLNEHKHLKCCHSGTTNLNLQTYSMRRCVGVTRSISRTDHRPMTRMLVHCETRARLNVLPADPGALNLNRDPL